MEDQHIFVWSIGSAQWTAPWLWLPCLIIGIILDWESFEHNTAFVNSEEHNSFMAGMGQVFDLKVAAPLTSVTLPRCASDLWS